MATEACAFGKWVVYILLECFLVIIWKTIVGCEIVSFQLDSCFSISLHHFKFLIMQISETNLSKFCKFMPNIFQKILHEDIRFLPNIQNAVRDSGSLPEHLLLIWYPF